MQTVLFRSDTQAAVLAALYLARPEEPWTIRRLAEHAGASEAQVSREVTRLVDAGLAEEERRGNQRLVAAVEDGPVAHHLRGLLNATLGAPVVLRQLFADRDDVDQATIFGSYAARAAGRPGPPPGDVDLLVIGEISPQVVYDLARDASLQLGLEVVPVIRTSDEWARDDSGFASEVRSAPSIDLLG